MRATLRFLADLPVYDEEQPYTLYGFPEDVGPKTNCVYEDVPGIEINDLRHSSTTEQFLLPACGFQLHRQPSASRLRADMFEDFRNRPEVGAYLEETTHLAMQALNAPRALCIDWRFRRSGSTSGVRDQLDEIGKARHRALAPAGVMHCDYSYRGGLTTLQKHLTPDEFQDVLGGGGGLKSVWRALSRVENTPLVFCDRRTVRLEDALELDQVSPAQVEQSMVLKYRASQRWFWLSRQDPEEVVLFTSWDSVRGGDILGHTPHGAFVEGEAGEGYGKPRESVEVRLVVMWQHETADT
ncbi:hypothetical protein B0T21DRAFT_413836 [Apiosordaria backusii]|uniref:Uncharacterized protein n=1 Tax=Apiosordaria backusii TaxID=314023 RepID=A0AA40B2J6_9PEZI|nr:hypothetical protein B0T21DRAFT_413836 [Apiosordaria backusii]